jgi:hypothetical protein
MTAVLKSMIIWLAPLLLLSTVPGWTTRQEQGREMSANGKGTIRVGQREFKVSAVVIKLLEDGKAEIILVSDITFFLKGSWSQKDKVDNDIDLKITGTITEGGVEGNGKVLLRNDGSAIAKLTLEGSSNTRRTEVKVLFVAR